MLGFESTSLTPLSPSFRNTSVPSYFEDPDAPAIEVGTDVRDGRRVTLTHTDLRHGTLISGRTGVGKSKLAEWMLRQLLIQREAHPDAGGAILFDPHWSLARDTIDFAVACRSQVPIVTIDPGGDVLVAYDPIRSNLEFSAPQAAELFSTWLGHAWRRSDDEQTPLLESNVKMIVRTLLEAQLTLGQAPILVDPDAPQTVRAGIVARVRDPVLRTKWARLLKATPSSFLSQIGSAARALARLPAHANVTLSQPASFSFARAIHEGWFVFIRTGGEQGLGATLSGVMLDDLWNSVRGRGEGGRPVHLIIDEFTQLCGPQMPQMLNGGRKFDLRMILLMQSATQLKHLGESGRRTFDEVRLNCLNKISFSIDSASGRSIADDLATSSDRLLRLPRGRAVAHTLSMAPGVSREVTTEQVFPMVVTKDERERYLAEQVTSLRTPFAFDRTTAIANYNALVASLGRVCVPECAHPDSSILTEPDEFTRVMSGTR